MAGHSKWNNIKRVKASEDSKRNKVFTKLSRDIFNAVALGGGNDPKTNTGLKSAIDRAKSYNLPMDKIQTAIKKASGERDSSNSYVTNVYEVRFESGLECLVFFETTNVNRTFNNIRIAVNKLEGKLLSPASIKWKFQEFYKVRISLPEVYNIDEFYSLEGLENIEISKDLQEAELLLLKKSTLNIAKLYDKFQDVKVESIYLSDSPIEVSDEEMNAVMVVFEELEDFEAVFFNEKYESFRD